MNHHPVAEILADLVPARLPAQPFHDFKVGDVIDVHIKLTTGQKTRIQIFSGLCIAKKGPLLERNFTVRKESGGVFVEKTFPLYAPWIKTIVVQKRHKVSRAKLYFVRTKLTHKFKPR